MIWLLVITTLAIGLHPPETVAMLSPALPGAAESSSDSHRMADLQKIQTVLESKVVRQRLEDFGLSQEEINARLAGLSDDQLHQFATDVDAIIPAGDGLGIVVVLLVIAIPFGHLGVSAQSPDCHHQEQRLKEKGLWGGLR